MLTEGELLRFWPKVDTDHGDDECWPWRAARSTPGYGYFWREGGPRNAQRVMWEVVHGEIPDGLCVLHSCDNKLCVNPRHLFLGTPADNNADRDRKGRQARGQRQGAAKLNREQVREIRVRVEQGETQRALGRRFGVHRSTVGAIVHHRTWAWLEGARGG